MRVRNRDSGANPPRELHAQTQSVLWLIRQMESGRRLKNCSNEGRGCGIHVGGQSIRENSAKMVPDAVINSEVEG
jgi:hypothetical protein